MYCDEVNRGGKWIAERMPNAAIIKSIIAKVLEINENEKDSFFDNEIIDMLIEQEEARGGGKSKKSKSKKRKSNRRKIRRRKSKRRKTRRKKR